MATTKTTVVKRTYKKGKWRNKRTRKGVRRFALYKSPQPYSVARKLLYSQYENSNAAAGALNEKYYAANGLFDPNVSGVGHQPRGFDQYMALYKKYVVISSKIKVTFVDVNGGTPLACYLAICGDGVTGFGSWEDAAEFGRNKVFMLSYGDATGSTKPVYHRSNAVSIKKWANVKNMMTNENFHGTSTSNPTNIIYHVIGVQPVNKLDDPGETRMMVTVEYNCIFFEPQDVSQS